MLPIPSLKLLGVLAIAIAFGVQHMRLVSARSEISDLRLAIAQAAAESERVTREAVDKARAEERAQRDALATASAAAVTRARADADKARSRMTDLQDRLEALDDPTVDAWRDAPVPEPVRLLVGPGDPNSPG